MSKRKEPSEASQSPAKKPEQDEEKKVIGGTDVIRLTNQAVAQANPNLTVRLNTSALFTEANWTGIKRMFELGANAPITSRTSEAAKTAFEMFKDSKASKLKEGEKKYIIQLLQQVFNINFTLTNTKDKSSSVILPDFLQDTDRLAPITVPMGPSKELNLESAVILQRENYVIQLKDQLYQHNLRLTILDADPTKCPPDKEFHENIHFLDHELSPDPTGPHLSTIGFEASEGIAAKNDAGKKEVLKTLMAAVAPKELVAYYQKLIGDRPNGVEFGAAEVLAFALQQKALGIPPRLETLEPKQILTLKDIIDSFGKKVEAESQAKPSLKNLAGFCYEFGQELDQAARSAMADKFQNEFADLLGDEEEEEPQQGEEKNPKTSKTSSGKNNDETPSPSPSSPKSPSKLVQQPSQQVAK
jgi:hypothetical protein